MRFYVWMGSIDAILYGIAERGEKIVADGIEGLGQRIDVSA
jgi:hypothetical protein